MVIKESEYVVSGYGWTLAVVERNFIIFAELIFEYFEHTFLV